MQPIHKSKTDKENGGCLCMAKGMFSTTDWGNVTCKHCLRIGLNDNSAAMNFSQNTPIIEPADMGKTWVMGMEIRPYVDFEKQTIEFDILEKVNHQVVSHRKSVINFQEETVRNALIQLGWTPPAES